MRSFPRIFYRDFWKKHTKRTVVLSPVDRISEVLYGLIVVLSFTGTISAFTSKQTDIHNLLWAALGCNLAWGLVDATMFVMDTLIERGHARSVLNRLVTASDKQGSRNLIKNEIDPVLAELLHDNEVDELVARLKKLPALSKRWLLGRSDLLNAMKVFALVFCCTLPVAIPFAVIDNVSVAIRVSDAIAVLFLFVGGYLLAGYAGFNRFITAVTYVGIGILLVVITITLGG